jgi:hypothetical protein
VLRSPTARTICDEIGDLAPGVLYIVQIDLEDREALVPAELHGALKAVPVLLGEPDCFGDRRVAAAVEVIR